MDLGEIFNKLWKYHKGKVIGVSAGIIFGLCVINFGFWRSLFLLLCLAAGLLIGSALDGNSSLNKSVKNLFGKDK